MLVLTRHEGEKVFLRVGELEITVMVVDFRRNNPDDYHAVDAVSAHRAEDARKSLRLYEALWVLKTLKPKPRTDRLDLGNATHAWTLQPQRFEELVALVPKEVLSKAGHRSGKAWSQWSEEHAGQVQLKWDDSPQGAVLGFESVKKIRRALLTHPVVKELIDNAFAIERPTYWECKETGLACKAMPDLLTSYKGWRILADLKTSGDDAPDEEAFMREVLHRGYHRQAAMYVKAEREAGIEGFAPGDVDGFLFIVVSIRSRIVRVFSLPPEALWIGRTQLMGTLRKLEKAYRVHDFSDPSEHEIIDLTLPRWVGDE